MTKFGFKKILCSAMLLATVGCSAPQRTTGNDPATMTDTSQITWSDGKPAYAISCADPSGCERRVLTLCTNGNYTTLKSENMPSIGTRRQELGPPSVVVRCS